MNLCKDVKESIKSFTEPFSKALEKKFFPAIKDVHYLATIMTPQFRKFAFIRDEELRKSEREKDIALLEKIDPEINFKMSQARRDKK